MNDDQAEIVQRMTAGCDDAFNAVVAQYSRDLTRLAYWLLGDRDEALDVAQEAFLKLVRRIREGRFAKENGSLKAFLLTCARNECLDRLRRRKTHRGAERGAIRPRGEWQSQRTPALETEENRLQERLETALRELPEEQRVVFILYELNNESYSNIASSLGLSEDQVRMRLHRARRTLRQRLEPYWSR